MLIGCVNVDRMCYIYQTPTYSDRGMLMLIGCVNVDRMCYIYHTPTCSDRVYDGGLHESPRDLTPSLSLVYHCRTSDIEVIIIEIIIIVIVIIIIIIVIIIVIIIIIIIIIIIVIIVFIINNIIDKQGIGG